MIFDEKIKEYQQKYNIIGVVNLNEWHDQLMYKKELWLKKQLENVYRESYKPNDRIIFTLSNGDIYNNETSACGEIVSSLQRLLNEIDITNFFTVLITNEPEVDKIKDHLKTQSADSTCIEISSVGKNTVKKTFNQMYQYNSTEPVNVSLDDLSAREQFLLDESKVFCIYPWIHLHAYPTGEAFPCCAADGSRNTIGNVKENTLKEIWNSPAQRQNRINMLNEIPVAACNRCYEQEDAGFFSMRRSANKHHGHQIHRVHKTQPDGTFDEFQMTYWDIRFSNLCNLSCRSCGHIFSSSWYQDQIKLAGNDWGKKNKALNYAGRTETDMWEQLIPHLDYVEQIYFAGGEPLMMEEHYKILEELERRGRFDVRLVYNTNFTQVKLKDRWVFDYWRKFDSVAVGASLDAMGPRAEYIRKGTNWDTVERNRIKMLETCPNVDFYISPTLSILNALHLPDFHRLWVDKGFIRAQDLNVNILQDPPHYRIDIAGPGYKQAIKDKFQEHLTWLKPLDYLQRATVGFESAIKFMDASDNTHLLDKFWAKTKQLDEIRQENVLEVIPELKSLQ